MIRARGTAGVSDVRSWPAEATVAPVEAPARSFTAWQLDLVDLSRVRSALDAGCGRGALTHEVRRRIAPVGLVLAIDLDAAAVRSAAVRPVVVGAVADIRTVPCGEAAFDLVTAGHVLYYADDLGSWLAELRRVLCADGVLLASANSRFAGRRLLELHAEACRRAGRAEMARRALRPGPRDRFTLEKGAAALHQEFRDVRLHVRDGPLVLADVDAALEFYGGGLHMRGAERIDSETQMRELAAQLAPHMRELLMGVAEPDGSIVIPRRSGCFVARP